MARSRAAGPRRPRLEPPRQVRIERGDREVNRRAIVTRELTEEIEVAGYQCIFGDDENRLAQFHAHFEAGASEAETFFRRLIAVRRPAHCDRFRLPTR
jgi:hypothetical protein